MPVVLLLDFDRTYPLVALSIQRSILFMEKVFHSYHLVLVVVDIVIVATSMVVDTAFPALMK